jgi:hypothetical protein
MKRLLSFLAFIAAIANPVMGQTPDEAVIRILGERVGMRTCDAFRIGYAETFEQAMINGIRYFEMSDGNYFPGVMEYFEVLYENKRLTDLFLNDYMRTLEIQCPQILTLPEK